MRERERERNAAADKKQTVKKLLHKKIFNKESSLLQKIF